ncbi:MAG: aminotransferase class I/II-fold pyridoxal phosphate-dependent enzyme [Myxococcota bacterium]|nr:aminotransferase class I/II-fold pyridoxal phosphate-dependent enzyme [Myxococcota bacterium]
MKGIPARIAAHLEAQEQFERAREHALRRHGGRLCDFAYANAQDRPPQGVREALVAAASAPRASDLQYTPYGGATIPRRLVAQWLGQTHGARFHYRDVVLTPGAMAALNLVFRALRTDGGRDEAIVIAPCWLDTPLYLENHGYYVRLAPVGPDLRLDVDRIASLVTERTRVVVLSQPANPTGLVYTDRELEALARALERAPARPVLVSDECHRDFVFEGHAPSPVAHYANTCVVYSFGKKVLAQGQRIGFLAVSPRMDDGARHREDLARWARITGFCTPTALMQRALGTLIEIAPPLELVAQRSARLASGLRAAGYEVPSPEATFFLYPKVPGDDVAFCARLAELGVLALPSRIFHHAGHMRLSVTATDDAIDRAIPLFAEALASFGRASVDHQQLGGAA